MPMTPRSAGRRTSSSVSFSNANANLGMGELNETAETTDTTLRPLTPSSVELTRFGGHLK
jgi:hypothetical protein